jgi:3-oxoacyl-[acyl-carrier-protein] synthase I
MTTVSIAGTALLSARGADLAQAVAEVRAGRTEHGVRVVPSLDGDRTIPYFSINAAYTDADDLLARVCLAALADAGVTASDAALFVGSSSLQIAEAERGREARIAGGMSEIARRVKHALGLRGPDYTINTACTSSAHALLAAHALLNAGLCETALILGVELANLSTPTGFHAMQLLGTAARPFDHNRDGLVLGDAVAAVVLTTRSPASALHLRGGANSIDTANPAGADTSGTALTTVMQRALRRAGVTSADIALIKAQAAGSRVNDAVEALALTQVFDPMPTVISVKGYVGHQLGASGCAELALLAGCWRAGFTPATAGCQTPDSDLRFRPLRDHTANVPRFALLNYAGFGGGQASLVVSAS